MKNSSPQLCIREHEGRADGTHAHTHAHIHVRIYRQHILVHGIFVVLDDADDEMIWGHMEPYGPVWDLMGQSGALWDHMRPHGAI